MKIVCVAGARPNFMKIAPIMKEFKKYPEVRSLLVHTGQHYDETMSKFFFTDLEIPEPDVNLGVGSGLHGEQTGKIMIEFEKLLSRERPDLILVVGDVNSTIACALVASKLTIKVAHVEAGLRSYDRTMPEEVNRILTDRISDFLFTTCREARLNLLSEGIREEKIFFVGNVMIDTLLTNQVRAEKSNILETLGLQERKYVVLTLHRPSNVDQRDTFERILNALERIQKRVKIVFSIHPRSRKSLDNLKLTERIENMSDLMLVQPLGYLDFLKLIHDAKLVMTDSGGIQEETTVLGVPCLTLRENTERPVTVTEGTNVVVGSDEEKIVCEAYTILDGRNKRGRIPELWDGKAAERIARILTEE
jgi:UDP-N-acetylglucosamine 2-epimerase (non-hydrolysing)